MTATARFTTTDQHPEHPLYGLTRSQLADQLTALEAAAARFRAELDHGNPVLHAAYAKAYDAVVNLLERARNIDGIEDPADLAPGLAAAIAVLEARERTAMAANDEARDAHRAAQVQHGDDHGKTQSAYVAYHRASARWTEAQEALSAVRAQLPS